MSAEIRAVKTYLGDNADGTPNFNYDFTNVLNADTHTAMLTGPIAGPITLADGTTYIVTDFAIGVKNEHVDELLAAINDAQVSAGNVSPAAS